MITVDIYRKKFNITCLPYETDLVANLPNRRYNQTSGVWIVPLVRLNIEAIEKWPVDTFFTDVAKKAIKAFKTGKYWKIEPFPENYQFKLKPFPYQKIALDRMWGNKNFALYMSIGTGKTKVVIDNATAHCLTGKIKRVLVVCLVSIKRNWEKEIEINCPIPYKTYLVDTKRKGERELKEFTPLDTMQWIIVGVESLSNGKAFDMVKPLINDQTMVVVDECQSIKSHKAKRTTRVIELGEKAGYRVIMTGTPVTQGIGDLYSQFEFLNPEIIGIGNFYAFKNRYMIMGGYENRQIIGNKNVKELTDTLAPYIFQVRKREVLKDLPPFSYIKREVCMSTEQKKLYKELKKSMRLEYEGGELIVKNVINKMQRFSEITGGFVSIETKNSNPFTKERKPTIYEKRELKTNPKLDELMNFCQDLSNDEPVVIWATGVMEIRKIIEVIEKKYGEKVGQLYGSVPEELRHQYVEEFQKGNIRFMIGNPSVGGVGLNLTATSIMVYYNRDFSLEKAIQSEGRIDRIGQKKPIIYIDIICKNTIDEYVLKALKGKRDFSEIIRKSFRNGEFLDMI